MFDANNLNVIQLTSLAAMVFTAAT